MKRDSDTPSNNQTALSYTRLLQFMLNGQFPRATPLNERRLSSLTGVSRSPLRAAIGKMVSEGFLVKLPHGAIMEQLDPHRVAEAFAMRRILEVDAAGLAAGSPNAACIAKFDDILGSTHLATSSGYDAWQADDAFHRSIEEFAGNGFAASMMRDFRLLTHLLTGNESSRQRHESSKAEHLRILQAIQRRDVSMARKAMDDHLAAERDAILAFNVGMRSSGL
jgi:DNA-binding GntR family transcriptional regulator